MADKIKLGEISKNLKITNKDIIAKLAEFGVELKSSASVVDEETIGLIFDIYTEMNQVSDEEIREMREAALKKASEDGNDEESRRKSLPRKQKKRLKNLLRKKKRKQKKNLLKKLKRLKKKQR
jgi:hypothetical protein